MILSNGHIYTLDADDRVVDTLVVRADSVVFAGRRVDVNAPAGEPEVDLGGRAVLPGLVDAHGHLMYLARQSLTLDVTGLPSEAACAERAAGRAASTRATEWITGRGWDQNRWPGGRFPTRASLDRTVPHHPVALVRVDGHATWVNTPALRAAGIGRHTPDPPGGRLDRDDQGEPTGILIETAQQLVEAFPWETAPRYLLRDRDAVYGVAFSSRVQTMGIHEVKTAPRAPWQNPYVERLIGTLRRECLDHVVVLNDTHLRRLLREYLIYYHGARTHLSLAKRTPRSQDRWSALTKARSSRRPWSAASIIATVGERRKLLSAGGPGHVDVAGRCLRLECAGTHSSVASRGAKVVHAGCPSYQRPTTKGRSRSQGTWID